MSKKCEICKEALEEEFNKIKGSMLRMVENKKARWIFVCSDCQRNEGARWIEKAKVKGA